MPRSLCASSLALVPLLVPSLLAAQQPARREFWQWFEANSARLVRVEAPDDPLLDTLAAKLHTVNDQLTFELGPPAVPRELVLSADGIRSAFPSVEDLYAAAPRLADWKIVKFRPRRLPMNELTINGTRFDPARVRFMLVKDETGKVGVVLFFEHYSKSRHDEFAQAGYLMLDEALGEYDVETRVGTIDFLGTDSEYAARSRPLTELPRAFDDFFGGDGRQ